MNNLTPRWLRILLWIVGAVNAILVVVNLLNGDLAAAMPFGIAGGVCLVLAATLPRRRPGSSPAAAASRR